MKKFNLKTLLILVLALILVFSLVACNKDAAAEETPAEQEQTTEDTTTIKSQQFFDDLWTASNSIGSTAIDEDSDIGVSADLSLKVFVKDKKDVYKEIDLGIALQLVYDRDFVTEGSGEDEKVTNNSALKIKLYNAQSGANWITLYYFLSKPYDLYMDYEGKNIVFNLDTGFNDTWAGALGNAMASKVFGETSISDILTTITNTTGKDFNLNSLVDVVLGIVGDATGFDISTLIAENKALLEDTLGIKGIYENEQVNLKAVFNSSIIKGFLKNSKCVPATDGSKAYSTDIVLSSTISQAVAGILPTELKDVISNIGINLAFGVDKDGMIDGFKITADLAGLSVTDSSLKKTVYPAVELAINELEFAPIAEANETSAKNYFGMTGNYSGEVSLDMALVLNSKGVTIMPSAANDWSKNAVDEYSLDGTYTLRIQGNGNVYTGKDFYVYAYFSRGGNTEKKAIEIAYNGKKIVVKLDKSVAGKDGASIVETIVDSIGEWVYHDLTEWAKIPADSTYMQALYGQANSLLVKDGDDLVYNENAADTYTLDLDVNELVNWAADQIGQFATSLFAAPSEAEATTDAYPIEMTKLKTIVADVISAIDTTDGLKVSLQKSVATYLNSWFKLGGKVATADAWYPRTIVYNANWFATFKNLGFDAVEDLDSYQDMTKATVEAVWNFAYGYFTAEDKDVYVQANIAKFEEKDADTIKAAIDKLDLLFGDRFVEFKDVAEGEHWYVTLFNLANASVGVSFDNGAVVEVSAKLNDSTYATLKLTVDATTEFGAAELEEIFSNLDDEDAFDAGEVKFN